MSWIFLLQCIACVKKLAVYLEVVFFFRVCHRQLAPTHMGDASSRWTRRYCIRV